MSNAGDDSENWQGVSEDLVSAYTDVGVERLAFYNSHRSEVDLFVSKMFIPAIEARGYRVLYVDLGAIPDEPALSFAQASHEFLLKFEGLDLKVIENDLASREGGGWYAASAVLSVLNFKLNQDELFIIIKGVEVLSQPCFDVFTSALRSFIVSRGRTKTLFLGGDKQLMSQVFNDYSAPFYRAASIRDFELWISAKRPSSTGQ